MGEGRERQSKKREGVKGKRGDSEKRGRDRVKRESRETVKGEKRVR